MSSTGTGTGIEISLNTKPGRPGLAASNSSNGELILPLLPIENLHLVGQTIDQFRARVKEKFPDLILSDDRVAQWRGIEALETLRCGGVDVPMILDMLSHQEQSTQAELSKKVQELARSNGELQQFAYVASHDLQEPLRMVSTYTQLLAERYHGKLDGDADKYIQYAVDGAVRMQALIHDLLEFSRAGRPDNGLKSTDCGVVVAEAIRNLETSIREAAAVVTCGSLPTIMAHAVQLRQVFQNLIGNAIKFHDGQPPAIQVTAERKENDWVFSVMDNGISIAPENAQIIFSIFQRLHTHTEYPGNGIGLAICRKIIEQHGGTIWLEPQTTQGATFKFTWPALQEEYA